MNESFRKYGERVEFFVVYVREAHPSDAWQLAANVRDSVVFPTPGNYDEKAGMARTCARKLGIEFPSLVDGLDNATEVAYSGWPDRLYVIGDDGRVAYKSKPGPFGFKPGELVAVLERILAGDDSPRPGASAQVLDYEEGHALR